MTDHAWFWPQYIMAVVYAFSMLNGCVETLRNKKLSSIGVTQFARNMMQPPYTLEDCKAFIDWLSEHMDYDV